MGRTFICTMHELRFLFWLAFCLASSCYGQDEKEGPLVPKVEISRYIPSADEEGLIIQKQKVATIPALGKEWTITFDITPSDIPTSGQYYGILLMARSDGDPHIWYKKYGNRYPGVWYMSAEKKILVLMALGTSKGKWMKIPNEGILAKDKTTKFKISQQMDGEKLMFKVEIDGEEKLAEEQTKPYEGGVNVFVNDPWFRPMPATLTDLKISVAEAAEAAEAAEEEEEEEE